MMEEKLDPKAKWRAKNRDKLNQYQRNYWRKKQAEKGLQVAEHKPRLPPDEISDKGKKLLHEMILGNFGLNRKTCREISQKYIKKQ